MTYNFDELPDRRKSECVKWHTHEEDVLPMWVADMDVISPEPVIRALHDRVSHGVFGYPRVMPELEEVIVARLADLGRTPALAAEIVLAPCDLRAREPSNKHKAQRYAKNLPHEFLLAVRPRTPFRQYLGPRYSGARHTTFANHMPVLRVVEYRRWGSLSGHFTHLQGAVWTIPQRPQTPRVRRESGIPEPWS